MYRMIFPSDMSISDGGDEVLQSFTVNIYNDVLLVTNFLGVNFKFVFQKTEPEIGQRDVQVSGTITDVQIIMSNKIRNSLGAGYQEKIQLLSDTGRVLLCSMYVNTIGEGNGLNVTLTFYQRLT